MNHYETAMLLSPALSDKDVQKFVQETREMLAKHGAIELAPEKTERRALAYPVGKNTEGTYVFINFDAPPTLPAEMKTELRHRDELLRLAFVRKPDRALKAEAEAAEKAAARAAGTAEEESPAAPVLDDEADEDTEDEKDIEEEDNG